MARGTGVRRIAGCRPCSGAVPVARAGAGRRGGSSGGKGKGLRVVRAEHTDTLVDHRLWHFPQLQFNSGYDLKFGWQERMYKEHQ